MPQNDAFALPGSGLNAFLFADVGTEQNGSPLTVLSVLARLGKDPWAQAAEWDKMPNAAKIEGLTRCISQMPLRPSDLAAARGTSGRLVTLLPGKTGTEPRIANTATIEVNMPEWVPRAALGVLLGLAIIAGTFAAGPPAKVPAAPAIQSITQGQ